MYFTAWRLGQQRSYFHAFGVSFLYQFFQIRKGDSAADDVLHKKHMSAADVLGVVFEQFDAADGMQSEDKSPR